MGVCSTQAILTFKTTIMKQLPVSSKGCSLLSVLSSVVPHSSSSSPSNRLSPCLHPFLKPFLSFLSSFDFHFLSTEHLFVWISNIPKGKGVVFVRQVKIAWGNAVFMCMTVCVCAQARDTQQRIAKR